AEYCTSSGMPEMEYGKESSERSEDVIELLDIVEEHGSAEEQLIDLCDILEVGSVGSDASAPGGEGGSSSLAFDIPSDIPVSGSSLVHPADGLAVLEDAPLAGSLSFDGPFPAEKEPEALRLDEENAASGQGCAPLVFDADRIPKTPKDAVPAASAHDGKIPSGESGEHRPSLEERLDAVSAEIRGLSRRVDEMDRQLAQQIADAGAMFLNDVSVRLGIEEMVSRMLDVRLPEGEPAGAASSPEASSDTGLSALRDEIAAIKGRLDMLSADIEQSATGAAARVIREEISALRLE
ncbi:MAG: hypothetical protein MJ061_05575, partial [Mailhella sp.]|nr:hypothetical protein [Mailhella sp.]